MQWFLVAVIVCATTTGEVLQTIGMRNHGEIRDFRPGSLGRTLRDVLKHWHIPVSVLLMAVSFFAFVQLLSVADLSFAVPATAASLVLETFLARHILKETVSHLRWAGAGLVALGVALLAV